MQQAHFLQKLYDRYYPKSDQIFLDDSKWDALTTEEKKQLAQKYLEEGEILLAKKNMTAINYFNAASQLDPENENVWFRQGKAFLTYGKIKKQEKALYLANKNFKIASSIKDVFETYNEWGKALILLGKKTKENHYLQTAKEKYEKAIELSETKSKESIANLYWQYANLCMDISEQSEEPADVRLAIKSFRMAFAHFIQIPQNFWCDFGKAYFQMGLFINDNRLYHEAIDYFNKSLRISNDYLDAWLSIAQAYTELYINTMDQHCFNKANQAFEKCVQLNSHDFEIFLQWAQLLSENGKLTKDSKKLKLAVEKCVCASHLNKDDPYIIGQWAESLALLGAYTNNLDLILKAENKIVDIIEKKSKIPELWYAYGLCLNAFSIYYDDVEYDELAIEKFQIGLSINRSNPELWHALALSYAKIGSNNDDIEAVQKALKFFLRAIDLKPSYPCLTYDYSNLLLKLATLNEDQKVLEEALFYIENTLNHQKEAIMQHPDWLFTYGCILDLLGDCQDEENDYYQKAIKAFHNVLLIDPDYPKIHYHIGLCYSHLGEITLDSKFFKRAVASFKLALKQNEEDDQAYLEYGIVLMSWADQLPYLKQYFLEAEHKILKAGSLGNEQAYYYLGCLYSLLNRLEKSINALIKANAHKAIPSKEELLEDEWLENVRSTKFFYDFINRIESKKNMVDGN